MRFQILGPVRVWHGTTNVKLGPPKQLAVLALLLAHTGHPVPLHHIVDGLWHEDPPATAVNVVHRHVAALRKLLEPDLLSGPSSRRLVRDSGGYRLEVAPDELDLLQFRSLREDARHSAQQGDHVKAVELLVEALDLWRGPAASNIPFDVRALPAFATVDAEHVLAVKEAARYAPLATTALTERVLVTLRQAASDHPLDEALQAQLIELLAAAGRQAEALETYQVVRARIADEIGLDPSPELQQAQRSALKRVPASASDSTDPTTSASLLRPAQLPKALGAFTGRQAELERLDQLVPADDAPAQAVVISGMAGVGKTTLAVHWANRLTDRFPDGQLYVDLRGFHLTEAALSGAEALRALLDAFGIPVSQIPSGFQAQVSLYRRLLSGRRILIVLDNARDSEQVRPVLPAPPGCLSVVTSRHQLQGLMAVEGAHAVTLSLLRHSEAIALLSGRLGRARVAREAHAAAEIVRLSGRLPLALAIVCARAALNPGYPLAAIADELRESHGSLDAFIGEPPLADARLAFSWSYRALTPEAARLFRLLALHPGPHCSVAAAASLTATRIRSVRIHLAELVRAHLLFENEPGIFTSHSLLRAYARELVGDLETPQATRTATTRVLDHYLHSAHSAEAVLAPHRERITLRRPVAHTLPERFPDQRAAAAWFDRNRPVLLAAVMQDGRHGDGTFSWQLAAVLELYLDRNGRWQQQRTVQSTAITAARREGDLLGQAHGHRALGFALSRLDHWEGAREHLERALHLFKELNDPHGQARVHRYGAFVANRHGRHDDALNHYAQALDLYRSAEYRNGEAGVHNEVGWTYLLLHQYEMAAEECSRSLAIHVQSGDENGQAAAWDSLGCIYLEQGHHDRALTSLQRALALYRKIQDAYLEADTLTHIADTHLASGRTDGAVRAWSQALAILEAIDHPDAEGVRDKLLKSG
ncbi:BTAD domain-containing putative transcriptional regulator [Streptomyces fructofermentans]|uniref:AfsR/SARP family transcriptional regulator n=1 Tax=Streptomyces fructofermentans TaxID=152141 RepID=UPI0033FB8CFA